MSNKQSAAIQHKPLLRIEHAESIGMRYEAHEEATMELTGVLAMAELPVTIRARALVSRGHAQQLDGYNARAAADYATAAELEHSTVALRCDALIRLAEVKGHLGDYLDAIAACTRAMALTNAPAESIAEAMIHRGLLKAYLGDAEGQLSDLDAVILGTNTPPHQKAYALSHRGYAKARRGDVAGETTDYAAAVAVRAPPGVRGSPFDFADNARFHAVFRFNISSKTP